MRDLLRKLAGIGGSSLASGELPLSRDLRDRFGPSSESLMELLSVKNGFLAFEGALHVYPTDAAEERISAASVNAESPWRAAYGSLLRDRLFFAQDLFGEQFCVSQDGVSRFNPESGEVTPLGRTLEAWAGMILDGYRVQTGFPLAHAWQEQHAALREGERLVPKTPFVLGGEYTLENLVPLGTLRALQLRAKLWMQLRDLPDGSQVRFSALDYL